MRRIFFAGALALPLLLLAATDANAQVPSPGCYGAPSYSGGGGPNRGYYQQTIYYGTPPTYGMFSFAMRMYPLIHFHGPLVNYGPYTGYYPFEPYGPWTSQLRYTGPTEPAPRPSSNLFENWHGLDGSLGGGGGHGGWGAYSLHTFHNVGHRVNPYGSHCNSCSTPAPAISTPAKPTQEKEATSPVVTNVRER